MQEIEGNMESSCDTIQREGEGREGGTKRSLGKKDREGEVGGRPRGV